MTTGMSGRNAWNVSLSTVTSPITSTVLSRGQTSMMTLSALATGRRMTIGHSKSSSRMSLRHRWTISDRRRQPKKCTWHLQWPTRTRHIKLSIIFSVYYMRLKPKMGTISWSIWMFSNLIGTASTDSWTENFMSQIPDSSLSSPAGKPSLSPTMAMWMTLMIRIPRGRCPQMLSLVCYIRNIR